MGEAVLCPALCNEHVFIHIEIRKHFNTKSVPSRLTLSNVVVSTSAYKTLTVNGELTFRVGPSSKLQRVEGRGGEGRRREGCASLMLKLVFSVKLS